MSFSIDELLRSCSVEFPSISLRTILEAFADLDSLPLHINIGKLLYSIIIYSKHARWAFHYPNLTLIPIDGKNAANCDISSVLRQSSEIALRFKHNQVTEMHFLLAVLDSRPTDVTEALSLVIAEYKKAYPQGTRRRQMALAFAIAQGHPDWIAETRRRIEETPYSVDRIRESILGYLSSQYHPYGTDQWDKFRRDYPDYDNLRDTSAGIRRAYLRFFDNGFVVRQTEQRK